MQCRRLQLESGAAAFLVPAHGSNANTDVSEGSTLRHYEILSAIGNGGVGEMAARRGFDAMAPEYSLV